MILMSKHVSALTTVHTTTLTLTLVTFDFGTFNLDFDLGPLLD